MGEREERGGGREGEGEVGSKCRDRKTVSPHRKGTT